MKSKRLISPDVIFILQEKVEDKIGSIHLPGAVADKQQTAVGKGTILKLPTNSSDERFDELKEGDMINFAPGTQISSNLGYGPDAPSEFKLIQILHINNVLWVDEES